MILIPAIALMALVVLVVSPIGDVVLWKVDQARGFKQQHRVYQDDKVTIYFTQEAHIDFYNSTFLVEYADGRVNEVLIDCDDHRWWDVNVSHDKNIHTVSGSSPWGEVPASRFDSATGELYAGYSRRYYDLDGTLLRREP